MAEENQLGHHPVGQEPESEVVLTTVMAAHEHPSRVQNQRPKARQHAGQHNSKAQDQPG